MDQYSASFFCVDYISGQHYAMEANRKMLIHRIHLNALSESFYWHIWTGPIPNIQSLHVNCDWIDAFSGQIYLGPTGCCIDPNP